MVESFKTFPIAEKDRIIEESGVTIPSEDAIKEGKDWVDFKEM